MEILRYPDPRLTLPNAPLERFGPEEMERVAEMFRIMAEGDGVGLAAPQVGWNVRLFVLVLPTSPGGPEMPTRPTPFVFYNPTVDLLGRKVRLPEGCLSFPGIHSTIERFSAVRMKAETPSGPVDVTTSDFPAHAIQHEFDHLDGVLMTDRMDPEERARLEPALEALRRVTKKD